MVTLGPQEGARWRLRAPSGTPNAAARPRIVRKDAIEATRLSGWRHRGQTGWGHCTCRGWRGFRDLWGEQGRGRTALGVGFGFRAVGRTQRTAVAIDRKRASAAAVGLGNRAGAGCRQVAAVGPGNPAHARKSGSGGCGPASWGRCPGASSPGALSPGAPPRKPARAANLGRRGMCRPESRGLAGASLEPGPGGRGPGGRRPNAGSRRAPPQNFFFRGREIFSALARLT